MKRRGPRQSAGLVMYRVVDGKVEVFLAHPGGPFFVKKDEGHWTIPKGEPDEGEDLLVAAEREFEEETGLKPAGPYLDLGSIQQKGGKIVHAWGFEGDWPEGREHKCNTFETEWPIGSGLFKAFQEIDRVCFFPLEEAKRKLKETQVPLIERLVDKLRN